MRFASSEIVDLFVDNKGSLRTGASRSDSCLACGSARIRHAFEKSFFAHWECADCSFVFVNPRPVESELVRMYSSLEYIRKRTELFEVPGVRGGRSFNITLDVDKWYGSICDRITRHVSRGAMLDIGGGSGRFLKFVKDRHPGFDLTLAELNEQLCSVARDVFGLKTVNGGVERVAQEERKFDAVVSIATIEHVFDPAAYLAAIRSVLNKGGILYMTGPRLGWLSRTVSTSAIYDVAPPVHLNFFDLKSMRALLDKTGLPFSIVEAPQSHGPVFHLGHFFCKHNYLIEDVIIEEHLEAPSRVYPHRDNSFLTGAVCKTLDLMTRALRPAIQLVDGQRVAHFVLRAT